jgi:hypothetical protein
MQNKSRSSRIFTNRATSHLFEALNALRPQYTQSNLNEGLTACGDSLADVGRASCVGFHGRGNGSATDARQVYDLPAARPSSFIGSSTCPGQRPVSLNGPRIGKSETCRASAWQSSQTLEERTSAPVPFSGGIRGCSLHRGEYEAA